MDIATIVLHGGLTLLIGIPLTVAGVLHFQLARLAVRSRRREFSDETQLPEEW